MPRKTLPIAELRGLLAAVSEHGKQHLAEVEADLTQTSYLLSEAIEKLGASFMAIHAASAEQQALFEALLQQEKTQPQSSLSDTALEERQAQLLKLETLKQTIASEANAAVTGLQFQDLTSQLITRTIKRINGLRDILDELAMHGNEIDPEYEHDEIARFLEQMHKTFYAGSHALSGGLRRAVSQQDMATGDIDLF